MLLVALALNARIGPPTTTTTLTHTIDEEHTGPEEATVKDESDSGRDAGISDAI